MSQEPELLRKESLCWPLQAVCGEATPARVTICVDVDARGIVVTAPPIARKFIGQPATNLGRWLCRQPGFRCQKL